MNIVYLMSALFVAVGALTCKNTCDPLLPSSCVDDCSTNITTCKVTTLKGCRGVEGGANTVLATCQGQSCTPNGFCISNGDSAYSSGSQEVDGCNVGLCNSGFTSYDCIQDFYNNCVNTNGDFRGGVYNQASYACLARGGACKC